jgi:hypothetical protein
MMLLFMTDGSRWLPAHIEARPGYRTARQRDFFCVLPLQHRLDSSISLCGSELNAKKYSASALSKLCQLAASVMLEDSFNASDDAKLPPSSLSATNLKSLPALTLFIISSN